MQTYNSFNELASAQSASPLVSDMSVFNGGYYDSGAKSPTWYEDVDDIVEDYVQGTITESVARKIAKEFGWDLSSSLSWREAVGEI